MINCSCVVLTLQATYQEGKRHAFRFLVLIDRTDRDLTRFRGDEPAWEKEKEIELTYWYKTKRGLNLLVGGKLELEDDSEINDEFTSKREVYIKIQYHFKTFRPF